MEQQSDAWHAWRAKGIGASEAPTVMGVSPWMTRLQLWEIKTGRRKPFEGNWATRRGNDKEAKARATYELKYNVDMAPTLVEHSTYPFIRASLDGYNKDLNRILEIKYPGRADHEKAAKGEVPEKYYPQIQHQFLATGAKDAHYWSFDGESGHLVVVEPDHEYCGKLLSELIRFWDLIQKDIAPEACDKDFEVIADDSLSGYCAQWKEAKKAQDYSTKILEDLEVKIWSGLQVPRGICNGVKFQKTFRKGNIDYAKLLKTKNISENEAEEFRKANIEVKSMRLLK